MSKSFKPSSVLILAVLLTLPAVVVPSASALTIETHFVGGDAPDNTAGGGDLTEIVEAAARIWESAFADSFLLNIYYGWGEAGDAGTHTLQASDSTGREIVGLILFDNSGSVSFYLDPTPELNEEYGRRYDDYQDLGGGLINVARVFSNPSGDAAGRLDLLSVALHEIGHALGLSAANIRFLEAGAGGSLLLHDVHPFAGTSIPLAANYSGLVAHFDAEQVYYGSLMSGLNAGERRMPSELDIIANALVSGFTPALRHSAPGRARPERPRGTSRTVAGNDDAGTLSSRAAAGSRGRR